MPWLRREDQQVDNAFGGSGKHQDAKNSKEEACASGHE